jgi:imidazolonepropionase-like amidohydrolase
MELFAQAGIAPMQALQAATLNNAKVLHRDKDLGTVEVGKYGDLLVLNADPLADIRNTQKIELVIQGGTPLEPGALLADNLRQFGERGKRTFSRGTSK